MDDSLPLPLRWLKRTEARYRTLPFLPRTLPAVVATGCALLVFVVIYRASWLCEDAFITLRTVDNWVSGYGLRWNVDERVQSYTHPLWIFFLAAAYAPWRDPALALQAPSLLLSAVFLLCFARRGQDQRITAGSLLLLGASKGFVEFSSPGLENPLVHVLLLVHAAACQHVVQARAGAWRVTLTVALLLLTRADLLWLVGPSFIVALWSARAELRAPATWLAWAPLVAWEAFSLLYYGFPVPNTAYAKLTTGVPFDEALAQGLRYFEGNFHYDPVTLGTVALGLLVGLLSRRRLPVSFALGLASWSIYLVRVGGDFMLGRLLTPALVLAVITLVLALPARAGLAAPWVGAMAMLASLWLPRSPLWGPPRQLERRWLPEHLTDERAMAYAWGGLFRSGSPDGPRSHPWVLEAQAAVARGERVLPYRSVGIVGFFAGPNLHIVDEFGLADPLLARLPAEASWNPGHFSRIIPPGYLETLRTGSDQIEDPWIKARYAELRQIISAPLFDRQRLKTLASWTWHAPSLFAPDYGVRHVTLEALVQAPGDGARVRQPGVVPTDQQGVWVNVEPPATVRQACISVGADDRYQVTFRRGNDVLWQTWLPVGDAGRDRLQNHCVSAPELLHVESISIRGRLGDNKYHVGRVALSE